MPRFMAVVGHDSVAMSQHYTHVAREALEKAGERFGGYLGIVEVRAP